MLKTLKLLSSETFAATTLSPRRWLWGDYLSTGAISLLTSRGKAGKTTLVSVLLSKLGTGGTLAGAAVLPATAIVVSEAGPTWWHERHALYGFAPTILFSCRPFRGRPTASEWRDYLAEVAARQPDLVVIDPLPMFLPRGTEQDEAALIDALESLHPLTVAGAAVLLVHQYRKERGAGQRGPRGSGALTGFADILIGLDRPVDCGGSDRRRRLKVDSRLRSATAKMIELTADGREYALLPVPAGRKGFEAGWPILKAVLEDAQRPPTRKAILKDWPEDFDAPSTNTLIRWLDRGARDGLVEVRGSGRHKDAFRYALKGQKFELDHLDELPPIPGRFAGGTLTGKTMKQAMNDIKKAFD